MPDSLRLGRRETLLTLAAIGGCSLLSPRSCLGQSAPGASGSAYNVLQEIPSDLHDEIRNGTARTDLQRYFDAAARRALARRQPLYVPAGTFPMRTWSPPANLTVLTSGRQTVFEQLPTNGVSQRFIRVLTDNVRLWPGGSATVKGNIAENATSFNSAIQVHADDGVVIESFVCGDVYGIDLGGDVLETGAHARGRLYNCNIGTIYGRNVYRNIVSITAGRFGHLDGVIQLGGVGLFGLDFEPDPGSGSPLERWTFGTAQCHRVNFVGDPQVPIGSISGNLLDLSYTEYGPSRPPFDYAGVNAAKSPALFEIGVRYRNCDNISIKRAIIRDFPRGAIIDIGENPNDGYTNLFRCDYLELHGNGIKSTYEIAQQKTRRLSVGHLVSNRKPSPAVATLIGGAVSDSVAEIEIADIAGRAVLTHTGRVSIGR